MKGVKGFANKVLLSGAIFMGVVVFIFVIFLAVAVLKSDSSSDVPVSSSDGSSGSGSGLGTGLVIFFIFLLLVGVAAYFVRKYSRGFNVLSVVKRDKAERILFDYLKKNRFGFSHDSLFEDHKINSVTGYYAAKSNYKWIVVCFSTLKKNCLGGFPVSPPRYSLRTIATSLKNPLENIDGPYNKTMHEVSELVRLSQYAQRNGGLFREPTKSEFDFLPDYFERALQNVHASDTIEAIKND